MANNYIDNSLLTWQLSCYSRSYEQWREHVRKHPRSKRPKPKIPEYVGEMILKICEGLSARSDFACNPAIDEARSDAALEAVRYIHNFDPAKTQNGFGYLTRLIGRAFVRRIRREQRQELYRAMAASAIQHRRMEARF